MIKNILFLLALLIHLGVQAQKKGQERTDSLLQVIRTDRQDTMKVRAMNVLATDWARAKPDSATALSQRALSLAKSIGYTRGIADSYFSTAQIYAIGLKFDDALKYYNEALKIYEQRQMNQWIGEASYAIGVIHQRNSFDESIKMFEKALAAALKSPDKNLVGKIAFNMGNTYMRKGDYKTAPYYNELAAKYYGEAGNQTGLANTYIGNSRINKHNGNIKQAIRDSYNALRIYEKVDNKVGKYNVYTGLGVIHEDQNNYPEALAVYRAAQKAADELGVKDVIAAAYSNVGNALRELGQTEEALKAFQESLRISELVSSKKQIASAKGNIGIIYLSMGRKDEALKLHEEARKLFEEVGAKESLGMAYYEIGHVHYKMGNADESRQWLKKALDLGRQTGNKDIQSQSYHLMMQVDSSSKDYMSALENYKRYISFRDSLNNTEATRQLIEQKLEYEFSKKEDSLRLEQALIAQLLEKQTLLTRQQQQELKLKQASLDLAQREKDVQLLRLLKTKADLQLSTEQRQKQFALAEQDKALQQSKLDKQTLLSAQKEQALLLKDKKLAVQRLQRNILLAGAVAFLLLSFFIFRNYRNQRKANSNLKIQQAKTEQALADLKSAQEQLIHSEKMASLGELTAGIAHEIQNPLNFVNNFSEINNEMLEEMKQEIESGNYAEALAIATALRDNNAKVHHHGKRADGIVKGMLQHSRTGNRSKEPIDINSLADEYLRLSYHGLRAKDKNFSANYTSSFDESIGKVKVVPEDIGRVLLNLLNNAFYAVNEKKKKLNGSFEPTVSVSTKRSGNQVEIAVKDNGNGIPSQALQKIYQPFFTTKPTGQGTGLGLSLSYDIIKAHGGELKVKTEEGEFAEFVIQLPDGNQA